MAERRMLSKKIIKSARFLRMPISSQNLYFHMSLEADDDGVVEAFTILRLTGTSEDDLRVLVAKGFIIVLNEDLVSFVTDWNEHNKIRLDRKVDSIYQDLLVKIVPDVVIQGGKTTANQLTTNGQPDVRLGKGRLGKDSLGKDSKVKDVTPEIVRHKYGEYNNVLLTDEHIEKLKDLYTDYERRIEDLSEYVESTGKKYKNHFATIKAWARKDEAKKKPVKEDNKKDLDRFYGNPD